VEFRLTSDGLLYSTAQTAKASVKITVSAQQIRWQEGTEVDLTAHRVTPGIQLALMSPDAPAIQLYTAEHFLAEGTVWGHPVKGYILFEHNYDRVPWAQSTFNAQRGALVTFSNEYDDGSVETGYFICGTRDRPAILTNSRGEKLIDSSVANVNAVIGSDYVLQSAMYTLADGSRWEFTRNPGASVNFATLGAPASNQPPVAALSFGKTVRVGETRKIVRWWTSSEAGTRPGQPCTRK
jgi:hypothetical protein